MKIIIPMAGMGKRMRPHTLSIPKPLIPIAGKPIVYRLVEDIAKVCGQAVEEVAFIIHRSFGEKVEKNLIAVAEALGAKGSIYYQEEALGTAHAIMCAKNSLEGNVVVAFADTLFKADFTLDTSKDGIIWVQKIEDPRQFGVVKLNEKQEIIEFVEKPQHFVSDLAIIGIYYFKEGAYLRKHLQYLLDNEIKDKGEYQLTNALENMKNEGTKFSTGEVTEWLDCGNKDATVYTNQRYLAFLEERKENLLPKSARLYNTLIIEPVFIGEDVSIENTVLGPYVSVGQGSQIKNSVIKNTIIQEKTSLENLHLENSMIGNFVEWRGKTQNVSVGDYNTFFE
ncbi:MAG: sugar phosphate nucleotidyltransferase [Thermonemataceae bacterium]|nr:sugar phosphate nucleotidyltransferase [Thermonemataceae bacterium]